MLDLFWTNRLLDNLFTYNFAIIVLYTARRVDLHTVRSRMKYRLSRVIWEAAICKIKTWITCGMNTAIFAVRFEINQAYSLMVI